MIVTVSGWRDWTDRDFVIERCRRYGYEYGDDLFWRVGCASGVDEIVRTWLREQKVPITHWVVYRAQWNLHGRKAAGPIRNGYMLRGEHNQLDPHPNQVTDRLLAFPQPGVRWRSPGSGTVGCMLDAFSLGVDLDIPGYKGSM